MRTHDFRDPDPELGKAAPYGVYDLAADVGWVNVGIDNDAQFAVASIRGWWQQLGRARYPKATTLTITADCGGSNGNRTRLWKTELQQLADQTGLQIRVCHFPPGTSKWNKVEHRLFSFISQNWRGKPLLTRQVIIRHTPIFAAPIRVAVFVEARVDAQPGAGCGCADQVDAGWKRSPVSLTVASWASVILIPPADSAIISAQALT